MNQPYCNDQAYIAEAYHLDEDYIGQMSRLAFFKINSYKLSLFKAAFCKTRTELVQNIKGTVFNYTEPAVLLTDTGFFNTEVDN